MPIVFAFAGLCPTAERIIRNYATAHSDFLMNPRPTNGSRNPNSKAIGRSGSTSWTLLSLRPWQRVPILPPPTYEDFSTRWQVNGSPPPVLTPANDKILFLFEEL